MNGFVRKLTIAPVSRAVPFERLETAEPYVPADRGYSPAIVFAH